MASRGNGVLRDICAAQGSDQMSNLAAILTIIGVAVSAIFGMRLKWKSDGRKDAARDARDADHEAADDLRNTVDRDLAGRVRKMDGRGYRD